MSVWPECSSPPNVPCEVVKIVGAVYLIVLGRQSLVSAVRRRRHSSAAACPAGLRPARALRQGLVKDLANPKMAAFFLSLLPQFFIVEHEPRGQHPLRRRLALSRRQIYEVPTSPCDRGATSEQARGRHSRLRRTNIVAPYGDPTPIWSFPARPSTQVIGERVYTNRFVVYFADSIKRRERDRILAAIGAIE